MSSQRQIEANRRNAQKSTGPRTEQGKATSRFNAVTHGMNAESDALPGEDEGALRERIDAWTADLEPRNPHERDLIEQAARISWRLARVEQAHVDRLTANIIKATSGANQAVENEALDLGSRLFLDLARPHGITPGIPADPNRPASLVRRLESSAPGCRWLLDRWAELRSLLEQDQPWQSSDKLKAVRLLGRYSLDVFDDCRVAGVFVACHMIDSGGGELCDEIWNGLDPDDLNVVRERLARRRLEWQQPRDRAEARQALLQIVEHAVTRLEHKADAHRQRAERDAASLHDRLSFDDSRKGEILRNYAASCCRALSRTIDILFKVRMTGNTGKRVPAALAAESSTGSVTTAEPGIMENEPNSTTVAIAPDQSAVTAEPGIMENEPNSTTVAIAPDQSAATAEPGMIENEPNSTTIAIAPDHPAATAGPGIRENEPNSPTIAIAPNHSAATAEPGIVENEPNSSHLTHAKKRIEDNYQAHVFSRDDRRPRSSPRNRTYRGRRGDRRGPLNTARPTPGLGAGRRRVAYRQRFQATHSSKGTRAYGSGSSALSFPFLDRQDRPRSDQRPLSLLQGRAVPDPQDARQRGGVFDHFPVLTEQAMARKTTTPAR